MKKHLLIPTLALLSASFLCATPVLAFFVPTTPVLVSGITEQTLYQYTNEGENYANFYFFLPDGAYCGNLGLFDGFDQSLSLDSFGACAFGTDGVWHGIMLNDGAGQPDCEDNTYTSCIASPYAVLDVTYYVGVLPPTPPMNSNYNASSAAAIAAAGSVAAANVYGALPVILALAASILIVLFAVRFIFGKFRS